METYFVSANIEEPTDGRWLEHIDIWNESISFNLSYEVNQARLTIKSEVSFTVEYWWQHGECFKVN